MCVSGSVSCLTLCKPMDFSLPGSPVHGILQARILEWVVLSFSKCNMGTMEVRISPFPGFVTIAVCSLVTFLT